MQERTKWVELNQLLKQEKISASLLSGQWVISRPYNSHFGSQRPQSALLSSGETLCLICHSELESGVGLALNIRDVSVRAHKIPLKRKLPCVGVLEKLELLSRLMGIQNSLIVMEIGESPDQPCHFWVFIWKNWKEDLRNSHTPMLTAASLTN